MTQWLITIGTALTMVIGFWKYWTRKNNFKREQAKKARKDLENAKKNDSTSDLLDAFNKLR